VLYYADASLKIDRIPSTPLAPQQSLDAPDGSNRRVADWAAAAGLAIARAHLLRALDRALADKHGRTAYSKTSAIGSAASPLVNDTLLLPDHSPELDTLPVIPNDQAK
jgi:hypothetical protein